MKAFTKLALVTAAGGACATALAICYAPTPGSSRLAEIMRRKAMWDRFDALEQLVRDGGCTSSEWDEYTILRLALGIAPKNNEPPVIE